MRMGRVLFWLLGMGALSFGGAVPAYAKSAAHSRAKSKPNPAEILGGALFLNSVGENESLYRACDRSDFKALALALKGVETRIELTKSEYETEAEFAARKAKAEEVLNGFGRLVVCQPLDDNEDAPFTYDAEREVFKGTFRSHQNVWRDTKRLGKYVSKTRMGVRATVTSSLDIEYDVDMGDAFRAPSDCIKSEYGSVEYEVPVPRAKAPSLKARGYLAFVGRLVVPFFDWSDSPGSPTLDDPRDVYERDMTIHFAPEQVAIVDPAGVRWTCSLGSLS